MKKKLNKKLPKYKDGGDSFGKTAKDIGLFTADSILAEWAPNAIKQDQYSDTRFGKQLGNVASVHESFDSQSPISKNVSKMWNDGKTGMSEDQMKLYGQAQPIAKTGSKIGEMWTMKGMSSMGNSPGTASGQVAGTGQNQMGGALLQGANMGLNTQYNPMQNMQSPEDSKITGTNSYGMKQQNPYYAQGGMTQPNAEVEKQENVLTPDGQFGQFNGPSHEQGGIPTALPEGTKVFSDRLKMPGTGKTFAILNKSNNTKKEDKILEDKASNSVAKATASLMKLAKEKSSNKIFEAQEALKQSKIDKYTMKLGGVVKYPDGGNIPDSNFARKDAQGFPVDITGRRLSGPEQVGFNRPGYTYGNNLLAGPGSVGPNGSGTNPSTGKVTLGLQNAGTLYPQRTVNLGSFGDTPVVQSSTMTDAEWMAQQQAKLGLPKQAYGGKFGPGGIKGEDEQDIIIPGTQSNNINLGDPTDNTPYQGWRDKYSKTNSLTPDQAATLNYTAQNPTPDKSSKSFDWNNIIKQGALGLANNAGNIYDLTRSNKVEVDKYDRMNPKYLDPTASLRDVDMQSKIAEYNIRDKSTGNAGTYLSNRSGLAASTGLAKDKIQREYQNINAGISNSAQEFNIGQHKAEDIANMQNRAAARNIKGNAISNIGSNVVGQYKDTQLVQGDKNRIELIRQMYPAIKNNEAMTNYYKTKYPDIWASIVASESSKTK